MDKLLLLLGFAAFLASCDIRLEDKYHIKANVFNESDTEMSARYIVTTGLSQYECSPSRVVMEKEIPAKVKSEENSADQKAANDEANPKKLIRKAVTLDAKLKCRMPPSRVIELSVPSEYLIGSVVIPTQEIAATTDAAVLSKAFSEIEIEAFNEESDSKLRATVVRPTDLFSYQFDEKRATQNRDVSFLKLEQMDVGSAWVSTYRRDHSEVLLQVLLAKGELRTAAERGTWVVRVPKFGFSENNKLVAFDAFEERELALVISLSLQFPSILGKTLLLIVTDMVATWGACFQK